MVISPIAKEGIHGENIVFEFGKIFIQKTNNPIKNLVAIFENDQSFNIFENGNLINDNITVNFQESGLKEIAFEVTFEDETTMATYATCVVKIVAPQTDPDIVGFDATIPFQPVHEDGNCDGDSFSDCYGKGEYKVYYAPGHTKILKPIIITDGFDPGDARKIDGLSVPWYIGEQPFDMVGGFQGALMPYKPETIYNMMYEYGSTERSDPNFIDNLHALGFDVILLSFPKYSITNETITITLPPPYGNVNIVIPTGWRTGSSDYFERSAKVVRKMIEIVSDKLTVNGSNEEIVLIGPSGGGILCRIALVEMEQDNVDHNVKLYVSFDVPHLGANVPIGMQKGAQYLGLEYIDALGLNPLNNPWSKQSLLHHYLAYSQYPAGVPGYRDEFQTMVDNLGFPQQCRNIAFNNGSTSSPHGTAGDNMFYGFFQFDPCPIFCLTRKLEMWVDFASNSGSKSVFKFKQSKKNIWGNWVEETYDVLTSSTYSDYGSLDTCPGSYLDIIHRTYKNSHAEFPLYYFDGETNYPFGDFDWAPIVFSWFTDNYVWADLKADAIFMPSKSTLAYIGSNTSWYEELGCRNLVDTGETPFETYYTPLENQAHVAVHYDGDGIDWLLEEIQGNSQDPVYGCINPNPPPIITGSPTLCGDDIATYSTNYSYTGFNHTWNYNPIYLSLVSQSHSNGTITLRKNPGCTATYATTLSVNVQAAQGNDTIGISCSSNEYQPIFDIDYDDLANVEVLVNDVPGEIPINQQEITDVDWVLTSGDGSLMSADEESAIISGTNFTGTVTLTNAEGSTTQTFFWPDPDTCYAITKIGDDAYQVIDRCNDNAVIDTLPTKELYDMYGNLISDIPLNNQDLDINNIGDSGFIYVIHIDVNGENLNKTIIKD